MSWDLSCPAWEQRLAAGLPLVPDLPLWTPEGERAVAVFKRLRLADVPGTPTMAEAGSEWFFSIVRALFGSLDPVMRERMIRELAAKGTTVIFSTHVIAHAERLCDEVAIIAGGKVPFAGPVDVARDRIRPQVRLETAAQFDGRAEHVGDDILVLLGREAAHDRLAGRESGGLRRR